MNNFDLRKYLAEGRLKVNEDHTLAREIDSRFGGDPYVDMWGGKHGTITFKTNSEFEDEEWAKVLNFVKSKGFEITDESNYYDFEPNEREWFPKIDFTSNTTSTPVTNEGKSAKELETHIAALSKARAQAASSGKTTLLNSLHRDISKAQKELKKLSTKVEEEYNVGKGMEKDHDFDAMLKYALTLHVGTPIETLKKVAQDFEDVNYHREVAYLEDAIDMLEAEKDEEFEDSLKLFKDEVKKTIRSFNESIEEDYDPDQEQLDDEDEIFMPMDDEGRPLEEALNPEVTKAVNRLIKGLAKKYDYSERDAVFAIQAALKQRGYDNVNEDLDLGHQDNEPGMLKGDLYKIGKYSMELYQMMDDLEDIDGEVDLPHWWQSKVTTAKNMISGAKHYLEFELREPAIDDMVDRLDGIAPETEIDVVDDENMEESIDKEFHSTSKTSGHDDLEDLSADELQKYINDNPTTLWGRSLSIAKMVLAQKREDEANDAAVTEDTSLNDEAKAYFMGKVKRGEIDKLPEDPKAAFVAQMTKDQMDHDKETSHREGELEEDSFYTDDIKNKVVSKLMDQLRK